MTFRTPETKHVSRAAALVDQTDRAPCGEDRAFLPGADMAQMLAGEIERTIALAEHRVIGIVVGLVARGDAEAVGHLRPRDRHRLLEFVAMAGMQAMMTLIPKRRSSECFMKPVTVCMSLAR